MIVRLFAAAVPSELEVRRVMAGWLIAPQWVDRIAEMVAVSRVYEVSLAFRSAKHALHEVPPSDG